jgi:hypothetical protein
MWGILVHDEVGVEATYEKIEHVPNGRDRPLCKTGNAGREHHVIEVE